MKLCLNMIVRDEAEVIRDTLVNVLDHLDLHAWLIHDTGSRDGTPGIIEEFFAERGIPGRLVHRKWENFGVNRQDALEDARELSDFVLFFDADDRFEGEVPELPSDADALRLNMRRNNTVYPRTAIVRNDGSYRWRGVVHEGLYFQHDRPEIVRHVAGNYAIISQRAGARSRDPGTYYRDARLLVEAIENLAQADRDLLPRYAFYCANSWRDALVPREAVAWYRKRIELGGWKDEVYCSWLNLGIELNKIGDRDGALIAFLNGQEVCPERAECLYQLARMQRVRGQVQGALLFAREGRERPMPGPERLFVWRDVYGYWLDYEYLLCLKALGRLSEGRDAFERMKARNAPLHVLRPFLPQQPPQADIPAQMVAMAGAPHRSVLPGREAGA